MKAWLLGALFFAIEPLSLSAQVLIDLDFEQDTVGSQPQDQNFTFSPSSNSSANGAEVIDSVSDPGLPISGKSLLVYDLDGDGEQGTPTHFRFPLMDGENLSQVRLDFDFRAAYSSSTEDLDTRIHVALGRAGDSLNNSDFRPFELRLLNNGMLVVNSISGSETVGQYDSGLSNSVTVLANSRDSIFANYDFIDIGEGSLSPNTLHVFLETIKLGEFDFHITPDPENAPGIKFDEQDADLGQIAFYQDSKRQGGMVFDNIRISSLQTNTTPPSAPSDLALVDSTPISISLSWIDNSDNEIRFVLQRKTKGSAEFQQLAIIESDVASFIDESVLPETEYVYRVFADNGFLSEASNELEVVTGVQQLPLILDQSSPEFSVSGVAFEISISALGEAPLSYQWFQGESGDVANPIESSISETLGLKLGPGVRRFWVRVSNSNGFADSETFEIDPYTPVARLAENADSLEEAISDSLPGDTILLASGVWLDTVIEFEGNGLAEAPIALRAETPGKTILKGESRLEIGGQWLVVDGLVFEGAYSGNDDEVIQFRANGVEATDCRLTNTSIFDYVPIDGDSTDWVSVYGKRNRVDHCYFTGHNVNGVTLVVWLDGQPNDHLIDYNHFANRIDGGENGWETIRIGTSATSMSSSRTVVERNLFTRVDGEIEIISNKSGDNVYRYNTFLESRGTLTLRHGDRCVVEGNYFLGGFRDGTGGVRVIGRDHQVINNYFHGTTGRDGAVITVYSGVPNSALNEYFEADDALIAFNTFFDNSGPYIEIGSGFGTRDRTILPRNVSVVDNLMDAGSQGSGSFVSGVNPQDQTFAGNLVFGRDFGENLISGYVEIDPELIFDELLGVARISPTSPAINASSMSIDSFAFDIDGQARDSLPDVGADEVSPEPIRFPGPITASQTGPSYLNADRQLSGSASRMINQSARGRISSGDGIMISGFVVGGFGKKRVLIRGIGPSLQAQSVAEAALDVMVSVFDGNGLLIAENDDWGDSPDFVLISQSADAIGATKLSPDSKDAAVILELDAGSYGILLSGPNGEIGNGLIEIYDLDFVP